MRDWQMNPLSVVTYTTNTAGDVMLSGVMNRPRPIDPQVLIEIPERKADAKASRDWYRIENEADADMPEILIYDEITDPLTAAWGIGIAANTFRSDLKALGNVDIRVHINSPGGNVFDGLAIYNSLLQHPGQVHVVVDGIAASIASVIAMAGDTVTMAPHSMMMIHEASGVTWGNAQDHLDQAAVLDKISEDIAGVYKDRGDKRVNWREKMQAETWFTAEDAVRIGLADGIGSNPPKLTNKFDLSRFMNGPDEWDCDETERPTKRMVEKALRDAGFSISEAKAFVSRGWVDDRDGSQDTIEQEEEVEQPFDAAVINYEWQQKRLRLQELALV